MTEPPPPPGPNSPRSSSQPPPPLPVVPADAKPPWWRRWWTITAAGFVALFVVAGIVGDPDDDGDSIATATDSSVVADTDAATTVAATSTTPPQPATTLAATTTSTSTTSTTTTSTTTTTTSTTTTTTTTTTIPGSQDALSVLSTIRVENEDGAGYDRDLFGYPATIENQCDTRDVVLIRDSLTPAQRDPVGCQVIAGDWYSVYDDVTWSDPTELQVDHVVAVKEAWDSGARLWPSERLVAFGNDLEDPRSLRAVTSAVNQAKSDADPSNWIPPHQPFVCEYLADWVSIKARWGLSMDQSEHGRIRNLLGDQCPDQLIAPWPDTAPAPPPTTAPPATAAPATNPPPPPPEPPPAPSNVFYQNCDAVRAAGADPIRAGDPGWDTKFDRDGDGIGCE